MAAAVEHVNLHRRIALNVMKVVGTSPRRLLLSFILPTAFLSMWISNVATTAMMVPIMEAVLIELESTSIGGDKSNANTRKALAMSVMHNTKKISHVCNKPLYLIFEQQLWNARPILVSKSFLL